MSGLRFKSSKKLPADSPYRRLVAAALPSSESCWPNKPLSLGQFGTIGCSSVQHSLVLSGLEEAVSAVDYELEKLGRAIALSALPGAAWRQAPEGCVPRAEILQKALWDRLNRRPPRYGRNTEVQS